MGIEALFLYLLGCYGVTIIVVSSKIFKPFREFFNNKIKIIHELLNCPLCFGFWVGVITSILLNYSISFSLFYSQPLNIGYLISYYVFDGAIVSAFIWFTYLIQLNLEKDVKDEL